MDSEEYKTNLVQWLSIYGYIVGTGAALKSSKIGYSIKRIAGVYGMTWEGPFLIDSYTTRDELILQHQFCRTNISPDSIDKNGPFIRLRLV